MDVVIVENTMVVVADTLNTEVVQHIKNTVVEKDIENINLF